MAKKDVADMSVEQKLKNLYQLQTMLSEIDRIKILRGELPLEVQDLEDEIAGLTLRMGKYNEDVTSAKADIAARKAKINEAQVAIDRYKMQLETVENSRQFDMLSKEIEFQSLEIELQNKKIGESQRTADARKADIENAKRMLEERRADLDMKKSELDDITTETKARKKSCAKRPRTWSRASNLVCWQRSSASVAIRAMVWVSFTYSAMLVVVASIKFRLSVSSTSVCVKKLLYASTADVS